VTPRAEPDPRIVDLIARFTPATTSVVTPDGDVAAALRSRGTTVHEAALDSLPPAQAEVVALVGDELSRAGEHAEGLLAAAAAALRPGGLLVAAARNRIHATVHDCDLGGLRAWSAEELVRAVGHPGIAVEHVAAPGAAAGLAGDPAGPIEPDLDRVAGLLDAAPRTLVLGRRPRDGAGRSEAFFASVPRKLVAAAVVCRDDRDRLLCVHDSFKGHWTIPGGVVDADEDPRTGAERETWEEAGVRVEASEILGVFSMPWPDRILLVYSARPLGDATPSPIHDHEVDEAAWVPLDEALDRLNARTAEQVRRCLDRPGATWADAS
jgi:8-oxo-dGTP pyrophosphatase MutT (NUDIX family)